MRTSLVALFILLPILSYCQESKTIASGEFKADKDKEFDNGSNISPIVLSQSKTEDLALLGKVWGFLKYYHPKVAQGDYNWDYELFRIMPKILSSQSAEKTKSILSNWVETFGEIPRNDSKEPTRNAKISPDLYWISNAALGENLCAQLLRIKDAQRTNTNYYVGLTPGVGNPIFNNEKFFSFFRYPDTGLRLLCLFRYWNTIQYYFPYKNLIEENWNGVLKEFIPKFVNATYQREYHLATLELVARIHDSHANLLLPATSENYIVPFEITFIENKAVINDFYENIETRSGFKKGDVVLSINNKLVEDIVKAKLPFTPASNYTTQLRDIALRLLLSDEPSLLLSCRRGDSLFTSTVPTANRSKFNLYRKYARTDTSFRMIRPDIAYFFAGTLKSKHLPELFPKISSTKGLIIDLRSYPKDFFLFPLAEYLMPRPTPFARFTTPSIETPGQFELGAPVSVGKNNPNYYKGKVIILVNEITISSAEFHAMAFRVSPNASVIGSQTVGADGNVSTIVLPGGIRTSISGIGVYYPDKRETQRIGIVPDIEVRPTIKGIAEGRDEVLEKAIELINKN